MGGDPWREVQPCLVFGLLSEPCPGRPGRSLPSFQEQAALWETPGAPSKPLPPAARSFVLLLSLQRSPVRLSPPPSLQQLHRQRDSPARPGPRPPRGGPNPLARAPSSPQTFEQHQPGAHVSWAPYLPSVPPTPCSGPGTSLSPPAPHAAGSQLQYQRPPGGCFPWPQA